MSGTASESGLFASLRHLLATSIETLQVRLSLLGTEVELEKRRVFDILLLGSIALLVLGVGVVLLCGFVILLFWEGYRLAALGALTLLFLVGGAMLMREARQRLQNSPNIFKSSVDEMARDRAELHPSNHHDSQ